jgi:hypothetical protein
MKRIFIFILLYFNCISSFSQIILEKSYKSISEKNDFYLGLFNTGDEIIFGYYAIIKATEHHRDNEHTLSQITLYNQNHSIRNIINLDAYSEYFVKAILVNQKLFPITKKLFNDDNKIELLLEITDKSNNGFMLLINEDGKELQKVSLPAPNAYYALYDLGYTNGTKMKVETRAVNSEANQYLIFQLHGTIPKSIEYGNKTEDSNNSGALGNFFPNPTQNTTKIYYELPTNKTIGMFNIYNIEGKLFKELKVGKGFTYLELNTFELPSGVYIGQLSCDGEIIGSKRLIVVK